MAIQLLPALVGGGRMAMQALPYITGAFGGLEGMRQGGLLGGVLGATGGYMGGRFGLDPLSGHASQAGRTAASTIPPLTGKTVKIGGEYIRPLGALGGVRPSAVGAGAKALVPLAAAALVAPVVGRLAGGLLGGIGNATTGALGNLAQSGAGILGYRPDGSPIYGGQAVPGGMGQYGPTDPYGSPLDILGPTGMARRLETVKSAEAQRDAMRMLLPEVYKATEATKKSDFERQAAMKGIAQNIATRAAMLQNAQAAGLQMGGTAAQQAGQALTNLYQYQ